ncbi:MAG: type II toxin-antitoxin system HicB family antitoxin [Nitrospirae bacterium]|nr:type II toxin-antitoxin system HicB family antitoxin [Nitrospirota bacterium]
MIGEYVEAALKRARYERIRGRDPYYGEIRGVKGVWATGRSLEECRRNLIDVLEGWILVRLRKGLRIPSIGDRRTPKTTPILNYQGKMAS